MKKYIAIILAAMTSFSVLSHTGLTSSIPARNEMLMNSPEKIEVAFDSSVRLVNLSMLNSKDEPVEIDFTPSMEASNTFHYDLPMMMPSNYKVIWMIIGEDGHKMEGHFSFMVHDMDKMKSKKNMHDLKGKEYKKDWNEKKMDDTQHKSH